MSSLYTKEFKQGVLIVARTAGVAFASSSFAVPQSTIRNWIKKAADAVEPVDEAEEVEELDLAHERRVATLFLDKSKNAAAPFEMTIEEFKTLFTSTTCAYTGMELTSANLSFERVDPFLGYTVDNTVLVTKTANSVKSELDKFLKHVGMDIDAKIKILNYAKEILINRKGVETLDASNQTASDVSEEEQRDWSIFLARLRVLSGNANASEADKRRTIHVLTGLLTKGEYNTGDIKEPIINVAKSIISDLANLNKKSACVLINGMGKRITGGEFK